MNNSSELWSLEQSLVSEPLKHFLAEKVAQARAVRTDKSETPLQFKLLLAAAEKGDWPTIRSIFAEWREAAQQDQDSSSEVFPLYAAEWNIALEIEGALEQLAEGEEKYAVAFAENIIASIPPGSIFFSGPDSRSAVIKALCKSQTNANPFFTLGQTALVDRGYLHYLRSIYGTQIYVPTDEDLENAIILYQEEARQRLKEGKIRPGEYVTEVEGEIQFGGMVSHMMINGLLAKLVFDKNPECEFFVDESFPLDWMYPHLSPHGLIMRIHRQPLATLSEEVIRKDRDYWTHYIQPMIGNWTNSETPIAEITDFVEKAHLNRDLSEFEGDPLFIQNTRSQGLFSKLRLSIGNLYRWRLNNATTPAERDEMLNEADFAYRQAFALAPHNPEAVHRYASLNADEKRFDNALLVVQTALRLVPESPLFSPLLGQLQHVKDK